MVQFLSINFFLEFFQFLLGFLKVPVFLCHSVSAKFCFTFLYTGTRNASFGSPKRSTALHSVFAVLIWSGADAVRNVVAEWLLVLHCD